MARHERLAIPITVHGHCLVERPDAPGPRPLVVGFHGYGETPEVHAERMRRIPGASECVLASLQALHLFYTKGGEVVASWMTKRDRERTIADNVAYVTEAVARIGAEVETDGRLAYVGFSQGAAMAYRAAAWAGHPCQAVAAVGGDMPPEVASDAAVRWPLVLMTRGEGDTFFTSDKMERDLVCLRSRGAAAESLVFDGGHEWAEPVTAAVGALLARAFAEVA